MIEPNRHGAIDRVVRYHFSPMDLDVIYPLIMTIPNTINMDSLPSMISRSLIQAMMMIEYTSLHETTYS